MSLPKYPRYKASGLPWMGEIPEHWGVMQSRRMFAVRSEPAQETDRQLTASQKHGVIFQSDFVAIEGRRVVEVIKGVESLLHVEPNDFIISMRSFQGGIEWCRLRGSTSFHYVMLRPVKGVHPPFFAHLFKSATYIQALRTTTDLIRDGQELRYSNFVRVDLPVVPPQEQAVIANFLDAETSKIDALVAEQERLIDLLKEKRQAVISQAVTKGLNPDAPMKDSGIEWLGDVPAHWDVVPLRRCVVEHRQGYYSDASYVDEGTKLLRITDLRPMGKVAFDDCPRVAALPGLAPFLLQTSDFVFARTGGAGLFGLIGEVHEPVAYASYLIRFRFSPSLAEGFLRHFFLSAAFQEPVSRTVHGGVNQNIHAEDIKSQFVARPPRSEQEEIASHLDSATSEFEALIVAALRAVELLLERRIALISAAVTGQIDVRPESMRNSS